MLLAAKALNDEAKATSLAVNGAPVAGALMRSLTAAELGKDGLTIVNNGDASVDAVISVIGAALTAEPAVSKGFKIERQAYTLDGKKVDLKSLSGDKAEVTQNDRFVMVLTVMPEETAGRVMVVDRLPAGFEIENPHLVESGAIAGLDWVKSSVAPEHTEFRDDRFVAAFNFGARGRDAASTEAVEQADDANAPAVQPQPQVLIATLAYVVRAVTPGTYVHPAATVEDMYRPEHYARTSAGTLTVTAKD